MQKLLLFNTAKQQKSPHQNCLKLGGDYRAAAMAYARLQFQDLTPEQRVQIERALLRYCELDTFAMVMILEAWLEWGKDI
ncbi:MAG: hypothetical protein EBT03_12275 [Betaproteobacteria bacterium]|nr:hypothetical protein [Betaproteobacteria bacterium]NBT75988.1 hypothetical protein [Betaproteobacteria bacterium]